MESYPIKVLVVEDNDIARQIEAETIHRLHCEVDAVSTSEQALDRINHERYDLVFVDIGLPDTDGVKLAQKIRRTKGVNQTVPIVALTSHEDSEHQTQAAEVGMNSYIVKPLTPDKCEKALKKYVLIDI